MKHAIIRYRANTKGFSMSKTVDVSANDVQKTLESLENAGNIITSVVYIRGRYVFSVVNHPVT